MTDFLLFARPLLPEELRPFDAVVFDPPRAGAEAQAAMIAKSAVPLAIAIVGFASRPLAAQDTRPPYWGSIAAERAVMRRGPTSEPSAATSASHSSVSKNGIEGWFHASHASRRPSGDRRGAA